MRQKACHGGERHTDGAGAQSQVGGGDTNHINQQGHRQNGAAPANKTEHKPNNGTRTDYEQVFDHFGGVQ